MVESKESSDQERWERLCPDIKEIKTLFHTFWSESKNSPTYDKKKWIKLQLLLWKYEILV